TDDDTNWGNPKGADSVVNDSDSEPDEELILEGPNKNTISDSGASTPITVGTRIILGWNHNEVDVAVIFQDDQCIHTRVWFKYTQRRPLWKSLCHHKVFVRDRPWCILGDFNSASFVEDSTASSSHIDISMREFRECVEEIEVTDVQRSGLHFTWNQKPRGSDGLLKKIDRILANMEFFDNFMGAYAIFKPYRVSDHSPSVLTIPMNTKSSPRPFKFFNIITRNTSFKEVVQAGWSKQTSRGGG
ncbi:RNA-directed DNA polymerase, eukaryota, reverse transcriptase zinc-binding domain protein, partial [Tanacetum coccineum]